MTERTPVRTISALEQPRMMIAMWLLTLVFAAVMFALSAGSSVAREWPVKVVSAVFALVGVLALAGMAWKTFGVMKFGNVPLILLDPLPVLGRHLRAELRLPQGAADAQVLHTRLVCRRIRQVPDGHEGWLWHADGEFPIAPGLPTPIVIELPGVLPDVELRDVCWHLTVTAKLPGKSFSRNYDIPVLAA